MLNKTSTECKITLQSNRRMENPEVTMYLEVSNTHIIDIVGTSKIIDGRYVANQLAEWCSLQYDTTKYPYLIVSIDDGPEVFQVIK